MMPATFDPEALDPVVLEGLTLTERALAVKIVTPANLEEAQAARSALKGWLEERRRFWAERKRAAKVPYQAEIDAEHAELDGDNGPDAILKIINKAMTEYEAARRREQRMLEARAAQEAKERGDEIVPAAQPSAPAAKGVTFVAHYTVTVKDKRKLVEAVLAGWGSLDILEINQRWLADYARTYKEKAVIPGCEVVEDPRPRG